MVKVLFLVPQVVNCGPLNVVFNIVKYLDRNKICPILVSIRGGEEDFYFNSFVDIFDGNIFFLDHYDSNLDGLKKIINDNSVNCIHSHGYYPDKLVSILTGIKKITTAHSMFFKDYLKEYGCFKGFLGAFFHFYYLNMSKNLIVVGCSIQVSKYCRKFIQNKKILTIHNGVDQEKYNILDECSRREKKYEMNLIDKRVFVYAGRFIRRKRVPELIEIFLKNSNENDVLILLGDGPEKENCENKYNSQNIVFLGQVLNPVSYYQIADFIISNSSAEGYPMSIIEAVSCGAYALLSKISPHIEFSYSYPDCTKFITDNDAFSCDPRKITKLDIISLSAIGMAHKYSELYLE